MSTKYPCNWKKKPFELIVNGTQLGTNETSDNISEGIPLIKMGNLGFGSLNLTKVEHVTWEKNDLLLNYKLNKGDFLFNTRNTPELVGKTAIWNNELDNAIFNNNIMRINFDKDRIDNPEFVNYYFSSGRGRINLRKYVNQTTSVAAIYWKDLKKVVVPVPPLVEQRGIAKVLGTVDEAIRIQEQVIAKTELMKQGLMQRLFTEGIGHTAYKETPLGQMPHSWKLSSIGEEYDVGTGGTPLRSNPNFYNGSIPWVISAELKHNLITETKENITKLALKSSNATLYPIGTLLIAMYGLEAVGTRGKCAILGVEATTNQAIAAIMPKQKMLTKYLYYYYQTLGDTIMVYAEGTKRKNLSLSTIKIIPIPVPPITEQNIIIKIIENQDKLIKNEIKYNHSLHETKDGLMQTLLSGERRVELRAGGLHRV